MIFLTDFADQAVVLPVAAIVLMALLATGWRRGALAWGFSVTSVLATMLALKLLVLACGLRLGSLGLVSPSGHTAAAAMVYGGLITLVAPRSRVSTGLAGLAGGMVALLIGATRLVLHMHTLADVIAGAVIGTIGAVSMRRMAGTRLVAVSSPRLAVLACVIAALCHGHRLKAETRLRSLALDIWPLTMCSGPEASPPAPRVAAPPSQGTAGPRRMR